MRTHCTRGADWFEAAKETGPAQRIKKKEFTPEMRVFLRRWWGKRCKCSFTAVPSSGKAADAGFPPLREEEKWQCSFTAVTTSGKAASAAFPSLGAEEKWQRSFTAVLSSDKEADAGFPPSLPEEKL
ncbi:hypothetical protein AAC387_Pa03g2884 [Persea americana]